MPTKNKKLKKAKRSEQHGRAKLSSDGVDKLRRCLQWAVAEQLHLLDSQDAFLITAIRKGRPKNELVKKFLKDYGLWRWIGFDHGGKKLDTFIEIAEKQFRRSPRGLDVAGRRWRRAVENFSGDDDLKRYSAFLKFYWFYQPSLLTMYDTYASKGLRAAEKLLGIQPKPGKGPQKNFLRRFEAVYLRLKPDIKKTIKMFDRRYPYGPRVLDKCLWLLRDRDPEQLKPQLDCFSASLKLAPLKGIK